MKKSLIALAVLAAAGAASAQSSVTLFGVVDVGFQRLSGDGSGNVNKLGTGLNSSSRLGFRGTEDLGGGMSAGFWLEAGMNYDDGSGQAGPSLNNQTAGAANGGGLSFQRRSTVSLAGNFGELRLGRDYVPSFWNHTVFDPFGTVGSGAATNLRLKLGGGNGVQTTVRASNSIGYFLPGNLGGFYGQFMYALGENNSNAANSSDGRYTGLRLGYANGPVNVAYAYGQTKVLALSDYKDQNLAGSYNFGSFTLMGQWGQEKLGNNAGAGGYNQNTAWMLGGSVPVGAGEIKASYGRAKLQNAAGSPKASQFAVGYVYNLSKRTAVYTTYSRVSNDAGVGGVFFTGIAPSATGTNSSGLDIGLRHNF